MRPKRMAGCHPERTHHALGFCRPCYRQQVNPEKIRAYSQQYIARHKNKINHASKTRAAIKYEWLITLKTNSCMDCGGKFPPECMHFDHVRGIKTFGISSSKGRSKEKILAEIAKCDLICANCHAIRHKIRTIKAGKLSSTKK